MPLSKQCPCCKDNYVLGVQILDAVICGDCASMLQNPRATSLYTAKSFYDVNVQRDAIFKTTTTLKVPFANGLFIDGKNQLFYIGTKDDIFPLYFRFDEVAGYEIKLEGGRTITTNRVHTDVQTNSSGNEKIVTKRKGVLSRSLVGGTVGIALGGIGAPIGAILGAATAKKVQKAPKGKTHKVTDNIETIISETKVVGETKTLLFVIDSPYGMRHYQFPRYQDDLIYFLDKCTAMHNALPSAEPLPTLEEAQGPLKNEFDAFAEVRKYKNLLDEGIITQDEFDAKKKELLNL